MNKLGATSVLGVSLVVAFFMMANHASADSTIGTNMSTTGTFTQTVGSATAARFQNAAGTTTVFIVDTTNTRAGVNAGGAVDTTFEVGGAASISGLATFGGNASVAGNFELTGASALLGVIPGNVIDTTFEVGGTASISGVITLAGGQIRPQSNSATAFRFQNAAGTTSVLVIDTNNFRVGVGTTPATTFEVQGTASASYFLTGNTIQVGGYASVAYNRFGTNTTTYSNDLSTTNDLLISGNLEVDLKSYFDAPAEFQGTASASYFLTGNAIQVGGYASVAYSRFGTSATTHSNFITAANDLLVNGDLEVDASAQFDSFVQMNTAATTSFTMDSSSGTQGACLQLKDSDGSGFTYLRVSNGTGTFSTTSCK